MCRSRVATVPVSALANLVVRVDATDAGGTITDWTASAPDRFGGTHPLVAYQGDVSLRRAGRTRAPGSARHRATVLLIR
jgi:hypothetical protein